MNVHRMQDVTAKSDGRLLARGFVSHNTLRSLQGFISSSLIAPNMEQVAPPEKPFALRKPYAEI